MTSESSLWMVFGQDGGSVYPIYCLSSVKYFKGRYLGTLNCRAWTTKQCVSYVVSVKVVWF